MGKIIPFYPQVCLSSFVHKLCARERWHDSMINQKLIVKYFLLEDS